MREYDVEVQYLLEEGGTDTTIVTVVADSAEEAANQAITETQAANGTEVLEAVVLSQYARCSGCDKLWDMEEIDTVGEEEDDTDLQPEGRCPDCGAACYLEIDG